MWTINILNKQNLQDKLQITVELSNGTIDIKKDYILEGQNTSLDLLKQLVQADINKLNAAQTTDSTITIGALDLTLSTPPAPTTQQLARQQYMSDLMTFKRMNTAISLGILNSTAKVFTDLQTKLKTNFDPSFIDLF